VTDRNLLPNPALLRFYDLSLAGDAGGLLALFSDPPEINTPLQGAIKGEAAFRRFVADQQDWLTRRSASARLLNAVSGDKRLVIEWVLDLAQAEGAFDMPVALVADLDGELVSSIRIYHSTWPLDGRHRVRGPLLLPAEGLEEPAVVQAYMKGLASADLESVLALFVDDGYAREPSGQRFKYEGPDGLRRFYGGALSAGGISLKHCTATFDGKCLAVEYICDEWAHAPLPPQSGLAVYELAGPDRLQAARIYDDVEPPFTGGG
jgi:hypothetical protein